MRDALMIAPARAAGVSNKTSTNPLEHTAPNGTLMNMHKTHTMSHAGRALVTATLALLVAACGGDPLLDGNYEPPSSTGDGTVRPDLDLGGWLEPSGVPTHTATLGASAAAFTEIIDGDLAACDAAGDAATVTFTLPWENHGYTMDLTAGALLTASATGSPSIDPFILLYGPDDGTGHFGDLPLILGLKPPTGAEAAFEAFDVPFDGTYLLVVTSGDGVGVGEVALAAVATGCGEPAPVDEDNDGVPADIDCDDNDDQVGSASAEVCDGVDNDCDGLVDEDVCPDLCAETDCDDGDACTEDGCDSFDGCTHVPVECNDGDACTNDSCDPSVGCVYETIPGADLDGDGIPDACDEDTDGDGSPDDIDCDPLDPTVVAAKAEVCDGVDNDCDGLVDEDVCGVDPCADDSDCDDGDACTTDTCVDGECVAEPMAGLDADGDGIVDACDEDADGDGIPDDEDCDPNDATVGAGLAEICDGLDNDCDGNVDEGGVCDDVCLADSECDDGDACTVDTCVDGMCSHAADDLDGDGMADACDVDADGDGFAEGEDCNDLDASIHPEAADGCDLIDNDCDGTVDEDEPCLNACGGVGLSCDDDNACTVNDTCWDGLCVGEPVDCDDGEVCTQDLCDPAAGCFNVPAEGGCAGGLTVELTWNTPGDANQNDSGPAAGSDLDLHYAHPNADGGVDNDLDGLADPWFDNMWDCFWFNPAPEWEGFGATASGPTVDIDDTDGAGPEVISHGSPDPNLAYRIGVHVWNDHGYGMSDATIRIYKDGLILVEATATDLETKDFWEVATITGSGQLQLIEGPNGPKVIKNYTNPAFP